MPLLSQLVEHNEIGFKNVLWLNNVHIVGWVFHLFGQENLLLASIYITTSAHLLILAFPQVHSPKLQWGDAWLFVEFHWNRKARDNHGCRVVNVENLVAETSQTFHCISQR
jgi:hypothetical protein